MQFILSNDLRDRFSSHLTENTKNTNPLTGLTRTVSLYVRIIRKRNRVGNMQNYLMLRVNMIASVYMKKCTWTEMRTRRDWYFSDCSGPSCVTARFPVVSSSQTADCAVPRCRKWGASSCRHGITEPRRDAQAKVA
jgi:hypothetical protein